MYDKYFDRGEINEMHSHGHDEDGELSIPDTPENQAVWPQTRGQTLAGRKAFRAVPIESRIGNRPDL